MLRTLILFIAVILFLFSPVACLAATSPAIFNCVETYVGNVTGSTFTLPNPVYQHDGAIAFIAATAAAQSVGPDNQGNTWTEVTGARINWTLTAGSVAIRDSVFYTPDLASSGTLSVPVGQSPAAYTTAKICEIAIQNRTGMIDVSSVNATGTSTSSNGVNSGNTSSTSGTDLILGMVDLGMSGTVNTGPVFSAVGGTTLFVEQLNQSAAGVAAAVATAPSQWATIVVTITPLTPGALSSTALTPSNPSIYATASTLAGNTQQFTLTGTYPGSLTAVLNPVAAWTSSSTGVATVNSVGLATGVTPGSTTIQGSFGGFTPSTTLTTTQNPFDLHGGLVADPCSGAATGYFKTEKNAASMHWWMCSPEGNRFYMNAIQVYNISFSAGYQAVVDTKYGSDALAYQWLTTRFFAGGFNVIDGGFADLKAFPVATAAGSGNTTKMPFWYFLNSSAYAMASTTSPVQDLFDQMNPTANSAGVYQGGNLPDMFSTNWENAIAHDFSSANTDFSGGIPAENTSPWYIGTEVDDSDSLQGFKGSANTEGDPVSAHDGWMTATQAPVRQFSNKSIGSLGFATSKVFSHSTSDIKAAWIAAMTTKYTTIAALNAAWNAGGSTGVAYTSFGTSGAHVTSETLCSGTCSTTVGPITLASGTKINPASVGIIVGGVEVGGDVIWTQTGGSTNTGNLYGISTSTITGGTINYSTKSITVTFSGTPASVAVTYDHDGWCAGGTGLIDECGSSSFWPADPTMPDVTTTLLERDLDTFLGTLATQYFSVVKSNNTSSAPNHLILAGDALHDTTRPPIISAMGAYMSMALIATDGSSASNAYMTTEYNNMNIPIYTYNVHLANLQSPYSATDCVPDWGRNCVATQALRGAQYYNDLLGTINATGSDGYGFSVGRNVWQMVDNTSENSNFGIVSVKDNIVNGVEDVTGSVACSGPIAQFTCGGDSASFASANWYTCTHCVVDGNAIWLTFAPPPPPPPTSPTSLSNAIIAKLTSESQRHYNP